MPRSVRRKGPTPQRRRRRDSEDSDSSSSSLDLSSDGGYSAVEEVSDSEDDDEAGVNAAEEKAIIKDVVKSRRVLHSRPAEEEKEEKEEDEDDEDDEAEEDEENGDDDAEAEAGAEADVEAEADDDDDIFNGSFDITDWNGIVSESEAAAVLAAAEDFLLPPPPPSKRQVRFAGVPDSDSDSDSDSTTTETYAAEFFPDIFIEQSSLDPAFRREIEEESDSSVSSSFWDYSAAYGHPSGHHSSGTDTGNNGHHSGSIDVLAENPFADDSIALNALDVPPFTVPEPATPLPAATEDEAVADAGYESDGDTTEEDEPEPLPPRRMRAHRVQLMDDSWSDSDSETDRPVRHRRGHPRVGRFVLRSTNAKPVAVVHPITGKMVIFTPEKPPRSSSSGSTHNHGRNNLDHLDININDDILSDPFPLGLDLLDAHSVLPAQSSPLVTNSASVMMGAMFSSHTFGDYINSQNIGPVEAFFPSLSSDAFFGEDSDFSGDIADLVEDDGESNLRIEDFIQFDRALSDIGEGCELLFDDANLLPSETDDAALMSAIAAAATTAEEAGISGLDTDIIDTMDDTATPTPAASVSASAPVPPEESLPPLLAHFDRNTDAVGAFRRNQIDQQLIYSNKATPESLAFSGPYLMGTLRGIKNGSLEAVTTPITPPRRHKRHSMSMSMSGLGFRSDLARSTLAESPLQQKRKASSAAPEGSAMEHKRQRSISEVKNLAL